MGRMLAVHIGDSFITYGLCEEDGSFVEGSRQAVPSHSDGSAYDLINALSQVLEPFQGQVGRVGVSVSCPFDYAHGVFHMTRKFSAMNGQGISPIFLGLGMQPTYLNDSTAFLLGETLYGVARQHPSCSGLMLGTSLGYAISYKGKILVDDQDEPAIQLEKKPYHDGLVDDYVSRKAIRREYHQLSGFPDLVDVDEINRRAEQGDFWARRVFNDVGTRIATALRTNIPRRLYGNVLVLGGKIAYASRFLAPPISNLLGIDVVQAQHVDDAVLRGTGAYLARGREELVWTVEGRQE